MWECNRGPLAETPRTLTRSVAAPAKVQRSVLLKGGGRQLHPRILRFGSRFITGINPIATAAGADSVTGPDPQRAQQAASDVWSQCSALFFDGIEVQDSRSARHSKSG
jgi:hypothetical protein